MKKFFIKKRMMLCVMMLAAYCVNATAQNFTFKGINYYINYDNKTVTVGENKNVGGILNIPATVTYNKKTYPVTKIGDAAFFDCSGLTQVNIPNSVTEIGIQAFFQCHGMTQVNIPNSVTKIGESAFWYCDNLTQVNIPNSVTEIGERAFEQCFNLTRLIISNSVTIIGDEAFSDCSNLTSISVASDNPNYDSRNNCNAIIETETNTLIVGCKNTIIPNTVTEIGEHAFFFCRNLTQINIPNSVTTIGDYAFFCCERMTQVNIPNSVNIIGESAFNSCKLTQVSISDYVNIIGDNAFYDCSSLTKITVPKWLAGNKNEMKRVFGNLKSTVKVNGDSSTKSNPSKRKSRRR